jgi:hypothetical protein
MLLFVTVQILFGIDTLGVHRTQAVALRFTGSKCQFYIEIVLKWLQGQFCMVVFESSNID